MQTTERKSYRLCQIEWCILILVILIYHGFQQSGFEPEILLHLLPPCVFRSLVGLYCPGCGGTRAVLELLRGNIIESLWYHPIVVYTAALCAWYLVSNTVEWLSHGKLSVGSRYHRWCGICAAIIVIANWILRNIMLIIFHITL